MCLDQALIMLRFIRKSQIININLIEGVFLYNLHNPGTLFALDHYLHILARQLQHLTNPGYTAHLIDLINLRPLLINRLLSR